MASKRQLLLELLASDKTGPATKGAADNLDKVALSAEEAAKATDNLGEQAGQTKEEVERFGKSNKSAAEHAAVLKHEIESTEHELHQLAIAFAEAETAADRADYSKAIRKTQSDLRKLNKSKGLIEDLVPSPAAVEQGLDKLAPTFGAKLKELWSTAGESAGPALGIAAAVAAPFVGAAISGAVIGGAGLGGIVGGLLLVSKNPQVTSALDAFKKQTSARLKDAATPFVPVALGGIHAIDQALKGIDFKGIFADAAKFSGPLIGGIAHLISSLGSGITDLIHNAGPAVKAIGDGIGEIGSAIGDGFSELSKDGQQGADALRDLFTVIDGGIRITFGLIDGLTRIYGALERINSLTGGNIIDLAQKWQDYHESVSGAVQGTVQAALGIGQVGDAATTATGPIVTFTDAMDAAATAGQSLYGDETNVAGAIADATKAAKENGKTLDVNTAKGRNNRTALLGVATAMTNNYDAFVKVNSEGTKSATMANNNRSKFIKLAEAMGDSKTQAEALADALGLLPRNVSINVHYSVTGREALDPSGHRLGYKAAGGPVKKGKAYVVGEKRPELFVPDRDGTIIPSLDQISRGGGGAAAAAPQQVEVTLRLDVAGAKDAFAVALMKMFRTDIGFRTTVKQYLNN